ncbi:MAG: hypothetical protein ACI4XL_10730 [Bacillus sp. (in: firmicutes)]
MAIGEILSVIAQLFYYGAWASLLFIPYWMFLYFSNEKKQIELQEQNKLVNENELVMESPSLRKE